MKILATLALLLLGIMLFAGCNTDRGGTMDQVDTNYGTVHSVPNSIEIMPEARPLSGADTQTLPPR
jgi:hypothetical protein